jgi:flagellar biosynthetic protein FliP
MLIAAIGVAAALAFVLGLGALALWALRRFGGGALGRRTRLPVEVVQKVPLGPKTHLAVVRVGEKVMAVSMGDGGVRPLFELAPEDRDRVLASSMVPVPLASSDAAQAQIAQAQIAQAQNTQATTALRLPEPSAPAVRPAAAALASAVSAEAESFEAALERTLEAARGHLMGATARPVPAPAFTPAMEAEAPRAPAARPLPRPARPRPARPRFAADEPREVPGFLTAPRRPMDPAYLGLLLLALALPAVRPVAAQPAAPPAPQASAPPTARATTPATAATPAVPVTAPGGVQPAPAITPPRAPTLAIPPAPQRPADPRAAAGRAPRRPGNGAQVTAQGAATTRATSSFTIDSVPRTPATVSADEALLQLMPQVDMTVGGGAPGSGLRLNGTVGVVVMMGLLTLLPTLLLMMTGFTRILIVLNFLKQALGTQTAPPGALVASLALLLTGFVMAPTLSEVNRTALTPWMDGTISQVEMMQTGVKPMRAFMLRQTKETDMATFLQLSRMPKPANVDEVPLHVVMAAFVASELRTAFQIGFAIYLPFIIIDTVVASVLMSMGMFMLPPAMISLPFKLLLFVLVDGWNLTITSLVQSFK